MLTQLYTSSRQHPPCNKVMIGQKNLHTEDSTKMIKKKKRRRENKRMENKVELEDTMLSQISQAQKKKQYCLASAQFEIFSDLIRNREKKGNHWRLLGEGTESETADLGHRACLALRSDF